MKWFRLYHDIIADRKIKLMPVEMRWNWIAILCVASAEKVRGTLPSLDEIACELSLPAPEVQRILDHLLGIGLIEKTPRAATLRIKNWEKRQRRSDSSAERVKRHEERKINDKTNVKPNASQADQVCSRAGEEERGERREGENPPPLYSDEIEDDLAGHQAFSYRPTVVHGAAPTDRSGGDLSDWNAAISALDSVKHTRHLADSMRVLAGTPGVLPIDGWRFLYAANRVQRPESRDDWDYFMAIARKCSRDEYNRLQTRGAGIANRPQSNFPHYDDITGCGDFPGTVSEFLAAKAKGQV